MFSQQNNVVNILSGSFDANHVLSMLFVLFVTHSCTDDVVKLLETHVDDSNRFYVCVQSVWIWVKFSCHNKSNYEGNKFGAKIVFSKVHLAPITFLSMFFILFVT